MTLKLHLLATSALLLLVFQELANGEDNSTTPMPTPTASLPQTEEYGYNELFLSNIY